MSEVVSLQLVVGDPEHDGIPVEPEMPVDPEIAARHSPQRFSGYVSDRMAAWREHQCARNAGRGALDLYQRLRAKRPELADEALYEAFVCQRNALEPSAARTILRRAKNCFATWPNERDLIFRDIVQYLVISEYLVFYPKRVSTTINMIGVLAKVIPKSL